MPAWIGPYRILDVLGEGGMGIVYLAVQKTPIRRRVAIKVIKLGMDSKEFLNRFEAERQALAMMTHNNIARVHEAGATEEGQPYLVMEYAPGLSLTEHCNKHRLGTKDRLGLFMQICAGVQHAHQKGVIHRDIKPANVLVTMQEGEPIPKIIDFGLARATDHRLTEATIYTEQGRVIGTPEYMSPEQAEMSNEGIDTRTDVYSLGVMLYELLVGDLPFSAKELRQAGLLELRRKICEDEPTKPSTRLSQRKEDTTRAAALRRTTPAALLRELRSDLDWIVMHAMEKDRDQRYATAAALQEDIVRYLGGEVVLAGPPSARYRFNKFVRRHRAQVGAAAMALLLLIGWMISATYLYFDAEAARQEASENADIAKAEAEVALRVADFLVEIFEYSRPDRALGEDIPVRMILDQGARRIETELQDQPEVRAKLLDTLGRVYFWLGNYQKSESLIIEALALQESLTGPDSRLALMLRGTLADIQIHRGSFDLAFANLDDLEIRAGSSLAPSDKFFLNLRTLLVNALRRSGRSERAEALLRESISQFRNSGSGASREMTICLSNLAGILHDTGRFQEARQLFEETIDMDQVVFPEGHPHRVYNLQNLSRTLTKLGEYDLAEKTIRAALTQGERVYGEEHPNLATILVSLGNYLNTVGRHPEAEAPLRRALAIHRKHLGPENPALAWSLNDLGLQFSSMGRQQDAKALIEEAVEIYREVFDEHLHLAIALGNLADIHSTLGEYQEAERLIVESLGMGRRLRAGDANIATGLGSLCDLLIKTGRYDEAQTAAVEAVQILAALPEEKPRLAHTHTFLALIANIRGDLDTAEKHAQTSMRLLDEAGLDDHKDRARAEYHLARVFALRGRREEALNHFESSLAIDRKLGLDQNAETAWTLTGMGIALNELGLYADSVALFEEALDNWRSNLPPGSPFIAISTVNLGVALAAAERDAEAAPILTEGLSMRRKQVTAPDQSMAVGLYFDGVLKHRAGSWAEASASAREALRQSDGDQSMDLRMRANIHSLLGVLAAENGDFELAEKHLLESQRILAKTYAPKPEHRVILRRLVHFYEGQEQPEVAQKFQEMLDSVR